MFITPRKIDPSDMKNIVQMSAKLVGRNSALWAMFPIIATILIGVGFGFYYHFLTSAFETRDIGAISGAFVLYAFVAPMTMGLVSLFGVSFALRSDKTLTFSEFSDVISSSVIKGRFINLSALKIIGHLLIIILFVGIFSLISPVSDPKAADSLTEPVKNPGFTGMLYYFDLLIDYAFMALFFFMINHVSAIGGVLNNVYQLPWDMSKRMSHIAYMFSPVLSRITLYCAAFFLAVIWIVENLPVIGDVASLIIKTISVAMAPYIYTIGYVTVREIFFDQGNSPVKEKQTQSAGSLQETFS